MTRQVKGKRKSGMKPFKEAREYARSLGPKTHEEWLKYWKTHKKPIDIPLNPDKHYKKTGEWISWGDWLDSDNLANKDKNFLTYEPARAYMATTPIRTKTQFAKWRNTNDRPANIPSDPSQYYKNKGWKKWNHFLHSNNIAGQDRKYRSFEEVREYARSLKLNNYDDWFAYWQSHERPKDIPSHPEQVYKKEWNGWPDFLGYEADWTVERIKGVLKSILKDDVLKTFSGMQLWGILLSKEVLNLDRHNPHYSLFKKIAAMEMNDENIQKLKDYANSQTTELPDISRDIEEEIKTEKLPDESTAFEKGSNLLDFGKVLTSEQVLKKAAAIGSICIDFEKVQSQVATVVREYWSSAFKNEEDAAETAKIEVLNGNKFRSEVIRQFREDYAGINKIRENMPLDYKFKDPITGELALPNLMQLYITHKIMTRPYWFNFSSTGTGKTLSAILPSRTMNAKMTVIICPNDIVDQWAGLNGKVGKIREAFPYNTEIISGREAFNVERDENKHKYLVINYDKFSQDYSDDEVMKLAKQKIDLLILDEVHFVKQRYGDEESKRHDQISMLRKLIGNKNKDARVLAMSATPVINNLREMRSLLDIVTGEKHDDIKTEDYIQNAVALYQRLALCSIREKREFKNLSQQHIKVDITPKESAEEIANQLKSNPRWMEEKILTPARIPEIIKNIKGKTIIYTEYVTEIVSQLRKAVKEAGYTYAEYTGDNHEGLDDFHNENKNVQVLIASKAIATGIDELQYVCNRLIINTLPWTNAGYEQLVGRIAREGQKKHVDIFIIEVTAHVDGLPIPYDKVIKLHRIEQKKTLADAVVDGTIPETHLVSQKQAEEALIDWIERIERNEISTYQRKELEIELTPTTEIETRQVTLGAFSKWHQKVNTEKSETTHERLQKNPEEYIAYHRDQYRPQREVWRKTHGIIPYEVIIEKIKRSKTKRELDAIKIGDFGCGEDFLAKEFGKDKVYSFDHVADNEHVIVANIKDVPLHNGDIDIAVFSLSLMNVDWAEYFPEAKRTLAENGLLFIAEKTKALNERLSSLRDVIKANGFQIYSEEKKADFTFIEARKL
jgi:superfamily II DNA or RNA helicase